MEYLADSDVAELLERITGMFGGVSNPMSFAKSSILMLAVAKLKHAVAVGEG